MIIDGIKIAQQIELGIKARVAKLPFVPLFCDVLVGNDPVSFSYVNKKGRAAVRCGMEFELVQLDENILEVDLRSKILALNRKERICGIVVQLPLPNYFNRQDVLDAILPSLDVDVIGSVSSKIFYTENSGLVPPTAAAILRVIDSLPGKIQSGKYVVVGQGMLVGKPLSYLLKKAGRQVMVADKQVSDLDTLLRQADVIISATGQPGLIKAHMLKNGAAVIDAGSAEMDGGIVGDVDFTSVKEVAAFITPVPGGIGPVTVAKLLENVVSVAELKIK